MVTQGLQALGGEGTIPSNGSPTSPYPHQHWQRSRGFIPARGWQ